MQEIWCRMIFLEIITRMEWKVPVSHRDGAIYKEMNRLLAGNRIANYCQSLSIKRRPVTSFILEMFMSTGSVVDVSCSGPSRRARMKLWRNWDNFSCSHFNVSRQNAELSVLSEKNSIWNSILKRWWLYRKCILLILKITLRVIKYEKFFSDGAHLYIYICN